jgi:hypothetical protein
MAARDSPVHVLCAWLQLNIGEFNPLNTQSSFLTFTTLLEAWLYARKHGLRKKPKRVSLHEWKL